ncbi:MAG: hypothetical protein ACYC7A_12455 [Thermoanaerobaculia bacterium]
MVAQRLLHQSVQFASRCVSLDLAIPVCPVLLEKPVAQLPELVRVEFRDLPFELFQSRHAFLQDKNADPLLPPSD